jgi:REP element-mobilizing transposase RayT
MATALLVVTPSPNFGEFVRRSLEDTQNYRVFVVSTKSAAVVRANEEACRMAFLDLDLGEQWVEEVGQALRTLIPGMQLFVLARDETPPALDSIRPWTLIRKPFHLPDLLKTLAPPSTEAVGAGTKADTAAVLPWLNDVNKAAQHLTRLTLESSSQAALITRDHEVWAYAGQLSQSAAQEVSAAMARNWDSETDGDLLRFARLQTTGAEHILYATRLGPGTLLGMVFDAETPFGTIRSQASQLGNLLKEDEGESAAVSTTPLQWIPDPSTVPPEPPAPSESEPQAGVQATVPPISESFSDKLLPDRQPSAEAPHTDASTWLEPRTPLDPGETRRSTFSREAGIPAPVAQQPMPDAETVPSQAAPSVQGLDETRAATRSPKSEPRSEPEAPGRRPMLGEVEATLPHSMAGFSGIGSQAEHIVLEPASAGVYHLTYACLLVPRFGAHHLTGDVADKLSEWMPIICVAFGWRLEYLAVRPEYLQWVVNVPPATSPGYVMRIMRQQVSEKIFATFPRLKRDNPSGDFWAPGYLIMGGTQAHPSQLVKDYIKQVRQRQGIEKPKK